MNHREEIELEDTSSSQQTLRRIASDTSLHSAVFSDEDSGDHAEDDETESFKRFTPDEEKTVVRKLDRHLVLFVAFLYMLSFLDRSSECNQQLPKLPSGLCMAKT